MKRCNISRPEIYDTVNKEINLLRRFAGKHVVQLIASDTNVVSGGKREANLLLEYCPGGHLLQRLNSRHGTPLSHHQICDEFLQLLNAVLPLHQSVPPVTHRDLKLENILHSGVST